MKMVPLDLAELLTKIASSKGKSLKLQDLKEHISTLNYMDLEEWYVQMVHIILVNGGNSHVGSVNGRSGITSVMSLSLKKVFGLKSSFCKMENLSRNHLKNKNIFINIDTLIALKTWKELKQHHTRAQKNIENKMRKEQLQ